MDRGQPLPPDSRGSSSRWSASRWPTWARTPGAWWCSATSRERHGGASSTRSARRSGSAPAWASRACSSRSGSSARCTLPPSSGRSATPAGSSGSSAWPRARSATRPTARRCSREIERRTGLVPRVISGREEARYDFLAIANSTTIEDGFGLDIGGGSIQGLRIEGQGDGGGGLDAARLRAGERGVPPRREGEREGDQGAAQAGGEASSRRTTGGAAAGGSWAWAARSATWPPRP